MLNSSWVWRAALGVLLLLLLLPGGVAAQLDITVPHLTNIDGWLTESGGVSVQGTIVNPLLWDIHSVEVSVWFDEALTDPLSTKTVERVPAGKTENFTLVRDKGLGLTKFRAGVTRYDIQSDRVPELLKAYRTTGSGALQGALARAFGQMSPKAVPGLLAAIDSSARTGDPNYAQLVDDLLCLEALATLKPPDAVQPLIGLYAWYEAHDLLEVPLALASDLPELALLDEESRLDLTLASVIGQALSSLGTRAVPNLLRATASENPIEREVAETVLTNLDKTSTADLLQESDPAVRKEIVHAMGEIARAEAIPVLLDLAFEDRSLREAVAQSLEKMGKAGIDGLAEGLLHPKSEIADLAEASLRKTAPGSVPELQQALQKRGRPLPGQTNDPNALVRGLRSWADETLNDEIDEIFEKGWSLYLEGDCVQAAETLDAVFKVRDTTRRHAAQIGKVYHCQAQGLAERGHYDQAISLSARAQEFAPDDEAIRSERADWLVEQASQEFRSHEWSKAHARLQAALETKPQDRSARRLLEHMVWRANLAFWIVGSVMLAALIVLAGWGARRGGLA